MGPEHRAAPTTLRRGVIATASAVSLSSPPVPRGLGRGSGHLPTKLGGGALPIAPGFLGPTVLRPRILGTRILRARILAWLATLILPVARGALIPAIGLPVRSRSLGGRGSSLLLAIVVRAGGIATIAAAVPATATVLFGSTFGSFRLFRIVR